MSFSSSLAFNALITTTVTKAAPTDDTEAPGKDGFEEEAADGTAEREKRSKEKEGKRDR